MISWILLAEPALLAEQAWDSSTPSLLERLLSVASLFVYVVLLTLLARPLFVPAKRLPACYFLCGSVAVLFLADLTLGAAISSTYEAYAPGSLFYAGVLLSSALFGTATLHPSMAPLSDPASEAPTKLTWWRLVLLTGATLMAPGVLAIQAALGQPIDVPLIVGSSTVLFLLVAARLASMIGERKILEERLAFRAFHDPLIQLPNRALFMNRFERALTRAERRGGKVAVLFVDLDNFKLVNDSLGHEVGDRLLEAIWLC